MIYGSSVNRAHMPVEMIGEEKLQMPKISNLKKLNEK